MVKKDTAKTVREVFQKYRHEFIQSIHLRPPANHLLDTSKGLLLLFPCTILPYLGLIGFQKSLSFSVTAHF